MSRVLKYKIVFLKGSWILAIDIRDVIEKSRWNVGSQGVLKLSQRAGGESDRDIVRCFDTLIG